MKDKTARRIGKRIRAARSHKRITLEQLARRVGVSTSSLSRIECGTQNSRISVYEKISNVLGLDVTELFREAL